MCRLQAICRLCEMTRIAHALLPCAWKAVTALLLLSSLLINCNKR